jgi:hypothetical protein
MKKVIASFGFGEHQKFLSVSVPTLYKYSQLYKYDLFLPNINFFNDTTMAPSWWKIDLIKYLFNIYDQVLWIDADVIICRFDKDISDDVNHDDDFGVVIHETPDGQVPNCGVWLLNKSCLKWIDSLKTFTNFRRSECWWEQAALLFFLGIDPDQQKIVLPNDYPIKWKALDYIWNPHIDDHRKIPNDTRFLHTTCFPDRYLFMKNKLQEINL